MRGNKRIVFITAGTLLLTLPGRAGKFVYGFDKKETAKITVFRPPEALILGRTLAVRSKDGVPFPDLKSLGLSIEQALASEWSPANNGKPDLELAFTVVRYQPIVTRTEVQTETRYVKVGEKPGKTLFGQPTQEAVYDNRQVPVQYLEASGSINLQVSVTDSAGNVEDTFSPAKDYLAKIVISENNQSTIGASALPTAESLSQQMLAEIAKQIQTRYTRTSATVLASLAVDDELRSGNALAISGSWRSALESWKSASMKKNPADRLFNMAIAQEALAYAAYDASRNPDDAEPFFKESFSLYETAIQQDPKEKYFKRASDRVSEARSGFARAKQQHAVQQRETEKLLADFKAKQGERQQNEEEAKGLRASRPDTPDEAEFRTVIRMRIRNLSSKPADAVLANWETLGERAYKLDEKSAHRVVLQEGDRFASLQLNREEYRTTFADLVNDKIIDRREREQLRKLAGRLELTPDDTQAIEAKFRFKEAAGARASAPSRRATPGSAGLVSTKSGSPTTPQR